MSGHHYDTYFVHLARHVGLTSSLQAPFIEQQSYKEACPDNLISSRFFTFIGYFRSTSFLHFTHTAADIPAQKWRLLKSGCLRGKEIEKSDMLCD
jgi:hypothetical protein